MGLPIIGACCGRWLSCARLRARRLPNRLALPCFVSRSFSCSWRETYGRIRPLPETVAVRFFPRLLRRLLAAASLQKTFPLGSFAGAAALRVRGSGPAHERSAIAGELAPAT